MARDLASTLEEIRRQDPAYAIEAYHFLLQALEFTLSRLDRRRHVDGKELLDGVRRYAVNRFGPMSRLVFEHWGVRRTEDFGRIVFHLVEHGVLSKTETDSIDDFVDVFDFKRVFEDEYAWTSD